MSAKCFLDTNTLVYILQGKEPLPGAKLSLAEAEANRKGEITLRLLQSSDIAIGVQVCNELCNVSLRKGFNWLKTKEMLAALQLLSADIVPLTLAVHKRGIFLHDKYRFHFYDALLLAAALESGCAIFYSEDMQHGQIIENRLTIENPFKV
jgi:predicted nucleic acid-binding protein